MLARPSGIRIIGGIPILKIRFQVHGRVLGLLAALCVATPLLAQSEAIPKPTSKPLPQVSLRDGWQVAETASFWVCCCSKELPAAEIAQQCETLRQQLCDKWFAQKSPAAWSTKCMVVLHPSQESYLAAVGQDAARTAGSSLVERADDSIAKRRIDLRGDRADYLTAALPHELTHVILADHFAPGSLPRWADEGMAVMADTQAKRDLHARDLHTAWVRGTTFRVTELLRLDDYPSGDRWAAFYGQSLSIVGFLASRNTPHEFVEFLDAAKVNGYDRALQDCYGIRDMHELERLWGATMADSSPTRVAGNP
jgi:hypothetical protein